MGFHNAHGMGDKGWVVSSFKQRKTLTCDAAVCVPREHVGSQHLFAVAWKVPFEQKSPLPFSWPRGTRGKDSEESCFQVPFHISCGLAFTPNWGVNIDLTYFFYFILSLLENHLAD